MKELKDMTVPEMRVYAAENNIPLDNLKLKPDIKNRIETVLKERAGEPAAPGEQPPTGTPPEDTPTASTGAPDAPEGTQRQGKTPPTYRQGSRARTRPKVRRPKVRGNRHAPGSPPPRRMNSRPQERRP